VADPKYQRLAARLRRRIESGEWGPGRQIPTETELEEESGFSRNTVRGAVQQLVHEGLLEKRQGEGTFVRVRTPPVEAEPGDLSPRPDQDMFVHTAKSQGREPEQEFSVETRAANEVVAGYLSVPEGVSVVVRRVERMLDGKPWSLQESFYPMDVARGTLVAEPRNIPHGTTRELAKHGHEQVGYQDVVVCRMPTPRESTFLGGGEPVIEQFRTAYSTERPIRLTVTVYASHTRIKYEVGDVSAGKRGTRVT